MTFVPVLAITAVAILIWAALYKRSVCLVKIQDEYAVRRGVLFYEYKDLKDPTFWWSKGSYSFRDCLTSDLEVARKIHTRLTDSGTRL